MTVTAQTLEMFHIYQIDNADNIINKVSIQTQDIRKYTSKLFKQTLENKNKRYFKFSSETSEIFQIVNSLVHNSDSPEFKDIFEGKTESIAKKLLNTQRKFKERYPGINPPKEGSLVVIVSKREHQIDFLISKVDQEVYISLEDFLYKAGLPEEKATQKTCTISYQINGDKYALLDIIVTDSKPKISPFWSQDFLDLQELKSNEKNTSNAFNSIDTSLSSTLKKISKKDYVELRNNLIGYFRTSSSFKLDEMIDYVIGSYIPENQSVDMERVKKNLEKLPTKNDFDTSFDIIVGEVKARFRKTYKISDRMELRTSDFIENMRDVISAKENEYGDKVLEIKDIDEEIYNTFKRED
jgi:hypothetical protein